MTRQESERFESYFAYLRQRSFLGGMYRRFWLYPILRSNLSGRVLDIGCGIGDFLASCPGGVGTDINPLTVDWCRRRGLDARLMRVDTLPFANSSFESVVLDNVLEHLSEPGPLLAEIHRVLTPGGRALIGVPGEVGYARDPDHKVFFDEAKLEAAVSCYGMTKQKMFYTPVKSDWLGARLSQYCLYGVFVRA